MNIRLYKTLLGSSPNSPIRFGNPLFTEVFNSSFNIPIRLQKGILTIHHPNPSSLPKLFHKTHAYCHGFSSMSQIAYKIKYLTVHQLERFNFKIATTRPALRRKKFNRRILLQNLFIQGRKNVRFFSDRNLILRFLCLSFSIFLFLVYFRCLSSLQYRICNK